MGLKIPWDNETQEALIEAWKDPQLCILSLAKKLGVSKSAILGKAHRLKLATRDQVKSGAAKAMRSPVNKVPKIDPKKTPSRRTCAWPIGHPDNVDFHYCGADVQLGGSPYCTEHHKRAYVPRKEKP